MTKIENNAINLQLGRLAELHWRGPAGEILDLLAAAIDAHHAAQATKLHEASVEIEGLKGDVRAAEAAFHRMEVEKDKYKIGLESAIRDLDIAQSANRAALGLRRELGAMTMAKDEWKAESARQESVIELLDAQIKRDGKQIEATQGQCELLSDAYENQKRLTTQAVESQREAWDATYQNKKLHQEALEQISALQGKLEWLQAGKSAFDVVDASFDPSPEWDGEGRPPVGTYCEAMNKYREWGPVRVVHHVDDGSGNALCVWGPTDGICGYLSVFRKKVVANGAP